MRLHVPFPSLRRWFHKAPRPGGCVLPVEPDRLAAIRNDDNQIVLVGVLSDDLSDDWVRLRTRDGGIYAVPKAEVVFLDAPT